MRKLLILAAVAALGLTGCNTFKGLAHGVGKDVSALGGAVKSGGDYVQEKVPAPQNVQEKVPAPQ
jgi:predicted small secreted protein